MLLSGKQYQEIKIQELKDQVSSFQRKPRLAIIVAEDYSMASSKYVKNKHRVAEQIGIEVVEYSVKWKDLDEALFENTLYNLIQTLNKDNSVDGIIVQLPIPYVNEDDVASWITPDKDVDGFNTDNLGKVMRGQKDSLVSCTPKGIVDLLKYYNIPLRGTSVCIVGRSNIVGKPLANLLINEGSTVTVCNSKTVNLSMYTSNSQIVITAIGKAKYFTKEYFSPYATVIDVGINFDKNGKMCGDVDFEEVKDYVENITPVPGGIGLTTVISLMNNTIQSYKLRNKK